MSYKSYQDYIKHQQSKQKNREASMPSHLLSSVEKYNHDFHDALYRRLRFGAYHIPIGKAVCLGPRNEVEISVLEKIGCKACGIDVFPASGTTKVMKGDFHFIPFANQSLSVVYTNSIDHALDPPRMFSEISRVLKPGGVFILEFADVESGRANFGAWECYHFQTNQEVIDLVHNTGLQLQVVVPFEVPWWGIHGIFKK